MAWHSSLPGRVFAGSLTRVVCCAVKEAEVLCHLYAQLGTDLLTKLKGDFAFVLYNAKLVRRCVGRHVSAQLSLVSMSRPATDTDACCY